MRSRTAHGASVDRVKSLGQIYEDGEQGHVLFDALLLELSHGKNHVYSTSSCKCINEQLTSQNIKCISALMNN